MIRSDVKQAGLVCSLIEVLMTEMHSFAVIFEGRTRFFSEKEYFCRLF
jgi:hypothetical protein